MGFLKLAGSELKCLRAISVVGNARAAALATTVHMARPNVSRTMASLEAKGFVSAKKNGISSLISLSDTKHATLWKKLAIEFAHMPLDRILAGASLEVLSTIGAGNAKTRREIAEDSSVSEATVAKTLSQFKQLGIIQKTPEYRVSPRFQPFIDFVVEFRHYLNQEATTKFAADGVILWERNREFIIETKRNQEFDGFRLTGVSLFAQFGIQLFGRSYYFYSPTPRKPRLEDAILHALLLPDRNMLFILLAWKRNQQTISLPYIERQAIRYCSNGPVKDILRYFETNGAERALGFPCWDEFVLRAREYGVS